jgi:TATA-box binding protein (TBP) (component of TFIID and TFIIIB)
MTETKPIDITFTPYRISTITVTGSINIDVSLPNLYTVLSTQTPKEISYLEFGKNKYDLQTSGHKVSKNKNKVEKKKRFDNQLTIVMHYNENKYNMKLFKNGNIQITGVKNIEKGKDAIDFLIEIIKTIKQNDESLICDTSKIQNINYRIRLINSDFRVNFEIRLDYLFKVITKKYNIICSYEPCIYPGAKIEYYYPNNGYCKCTAFCNGKSDVCKKITIAVFQSGCVIITGANKTEHIEVAYNFICNILKENYEDIHRKKLCLPIKV